MASLKRLHAPLAWVAGRWQREVLLTVDASGHWSEIAVQTPPPPDAERLAGPVIPSLVNAHSHAFQRAFVGLAERREAGEDDFWSWRDRMYALALRISPQQLRASHGPSSQEPVFRLHALQGVDGDRLRQVA